MRSTCGVWASGRPPQTRKQRKTVQNSVFGTKTTVTAQNSKKLNSKLEFRASFCITNLKYYIYEASAEYGRRRGLYRRENAEKQCKTVQNSDFGAKTIVTAQHSNFLIQHFEFQASCCITNLKHYIYKASAEYGRWGGLHRREHVEKQCKTVILAPKRPLQLSKFKVLNSKFQFQASSCITDRKYYIYEASAGYGRREASTDEKIAKIAKNSEK